MIALYPIKPKYMQRILSGEKRYELRRRLPKNDINFVVLYSTSPESKIVGYAEVKTTHKLPPNDLWKKVKQEAGISKDDYDLYFEGIENACAIEFKKAFVLDCPISLAVLDEAMSVPQSFCYVAGDAFKKLCELGSYRYEFGS